MAKPYHTEETCEDFNCTECWYVLTEEDLDGWLTNMIDEEYWDGE